MDIFLRKFYKELYSRIDISNTNIYIFKLRLSSYDYGGNMKVEAKCKGCGAIFVIDEFVPEDMNCFCGSEEFDMTEKKEIVA